MGKLTLILGGARSGKSRYAQRLALERGQRVVYLATAQALDEEMSARIAAHRKQRPPHWETLEIPMGIVDALEEHPIKADLVLLDCLTLLVSNLALACTQDGKNNTAEAATAVDHEVDSLLAAIRAGGVDWIVVTNEVGMGLVPDNPLGRLYRDLLGRANQQLAAAAEEVCLMVAGIPLLLPGDKPERD